MANNFNVNKKEFIMNLSHMKMQIKSLTINSRFLRAEANRLKRPKLVPEEIKYGIGDSGVSYKKIVSFTEASEQKLAKWKAKAAKRSEQSRMNRDNLFRDIVSRRTINIRRMARANFLAYAFLRNRPYSITEVVRYEDNKQALPFFEVRYMAFLNVATELFVQKVEFNQDELQLKFNEWIEGGEGYVIPPTEPVVP